MGQTSRSVFSVTVNIKCHNYNKPIVNMFYVLLRSTLPPDSVVKNNETSAANKKDWPDSTIYMVVDVDSEDERKSVCMS